MPPARSPATSGSARRARQVSCLQGTLNGLGYNSGPVDGKFGGVTFRAVVAFQRAKGLLVDGLVGRQTGTALGIWGAAASGGGTTTPTTPSTPSTPASPSGCRISTSLRLGSSGSQVQCLQAALNAAGYPVGPVDGAFGNQTRRGVVAFQTAKRLVVDGVAGRQTGTALGIWGAASSGGGTTGGSSSSCTPPSGTPAAARQVLVVDVVGSRAPTSTCSCTPGRSGSVPAPTWSAASVATACAPCPHGARATAPHPAGSSRWAR